MELIIYINLDGAQLRSSMLEDLKKDLKFAVCGVLGAVSDRRLMNSLDYEVEIHTKEDSDE